MRFVAASIAHAPPSGSTVLATPLSLAITCWVRSAVRAASSVGRPSASSLAVAVQRLRASQHGGERLHRDADDVVVGLLRGERAAGGLRVEAELLRARVRRAETVAHDPGPQPARRAELRHLFEEIVVRVEEEREPLAERVDVETRVERAAST